MWERVVGLTEMFPDTFRTTVSTAFSGSVSAAKTSFGILRHATWIIASTSIIAVMPYVIEKERHDYEEKIRQDERNVHFILKGSVNITGQNF